MSEIRKRNAGDSKEAQVNGAASKKNVRDSSNTFRVTDVLRILGGILLLNCTLSWFITNNSITWGWRPWFSKPGDVKAWINGPLHLTDLELSAYDGTDPTKPIYVALNGSIYDVTAGARMYGPGGSYSFFAGRDATRAFITGCFAEDLTPDLRGAELTYVPLDEPEPEGEGEGEKKLSKGEIKTRREREMRLARKKVNDTIEGWARMFRGEGGKPYFLVGEVRRGEGWLERLPRRELCEGAQKQRPKRDGK